MMPSFLLFYIQSGLLTQSEETRVVSDLVVAKPDSDVREVRVVGVRQRVRQVHAGAAIETYAGVAIDYFLAQSRSAVTILMVEQG